MQIDNEDEKVAKEWLRRYDPEPKKCEDDPPDYLIAGDIAVEVTRLSCNEESTLKPLRKVAGAVLREYVFPDDQPGWNVDVDPARDRSLPRTEDTKKIIRAAIKQFMERDCYYYEDKDSGIEIYFSDDPSHSGFELVGTDFNEGEWEGDIISKIQRCIDKKSAKVRSKIDQYKTWWLLLVDHAHPGLGASLSNISCDRIDTKLWSRVIVLDFHQKEVLMECPNHRQGLPGRKR